MTTDSRVREFLDGPPGHARVLGPPGSGKTTLLVERYRALVARGHRPGIVAFGRDPQQRLLDLIVTPGGSHLGPTPVTTHALIATAILDVARPGRPRTLRDVDELLVLGRLLRRDPSLLASDLAAIAGSPTFLRDLLEAMHALAQHGLDDDAVRKAASASAGPRVRDVFAVYARYRKECATRGLVTFYDAAWRAAERFEAGGIDSPLADFDVVLIDDFHDLDPGQFRLLSRLVPANGPAAVEVFGDPTGARFAFRGTTERYMERFQHDYAPMDLELGAPRSNDVALNETLARLIAQTATTSPAAPSSSPPDLPLFANVTAHGAHPARPAWDCEVTLVVADDEIAEVQAVASRVRSLLDSGATARDIAVLARDPAHYRSALRVACHEWGVPLDAGGDGHGAAEDFVRSLLGALGTDTDGRLAEALAASPFFPAFGGEDRDAAAIVRALRREYAQRSGGFDLERMVGERVTPMLPRGDDASHAAIAAVVDEWRRYGEVAKSAGGSISLDEFRATYLGEPVHRGVATGGVALLSPREATGRSFAAAFVCGCAEGFFPAATVHDGYISMTALARALEGVDADAAADLAARVDETAVERAENALFLTAITRARDTVTLLCPARIGGESTLPARVLGADTRPFAVEAAGRTTSPCARAAAVTASSPSSAELSARLRPLDTLAGWWVSPPRPERLPALESFSMSASKLGAFTRCARQFFYRKVLKLEEPESIYLRVGSLVHEALNEIITTGSTGEEVRAALRDTGTREIAERLVSKEMKDAGAWMKELSVRYLEDMLASVVKLESEREGAYRVRMLEEPVEATIEGMPLSGRMDRVDDVEGVGPVIIDYKTSGSIKRTHTKVIELLETDYWQVPVYASIAADKGPGAAGFVYYALPPGEEGFAVGVQLAPGHRPAPIQLGPRRPYRYGPIPTELVADAMAHAVEIHRSIVQGECRYERTENTGICPNCHFARICQRSHASI